jgi:hypothetical protein
MLKAPGTVSSGCSADVDWPSRLPAGPLPAAANRTGRWARARPRRPLDADGTDWARRAGARRTAGRPDGARHGVRRTGAAAHWGLGRGGMGTGRGVRRTGTARRGAARGEPA